MLFRSYLSVRPPGLDPIGLLFHDGQLTEVPIRVSPLCSRAFPKMEGILRQRGVLHSTHLAHARVFMADMAELAEAAAEAFLAAPDRYLCEWGCLNCAAARAVC